MPQQSAAKETQEAASNKTQLPTSETFQQSASKTSKQSASATPEQAVLKPLHSHASQTLEPNIPQTSQPSASEKSGLRVDRQDIPEMSQPSTPKTPQRDVPRMSQLAATNTSQQDFSKTSQPHAVHGSQQPASMEFQQAAAGPSQQPIFKKPLIPASKMRQIPATGNILVKKGTQAAPAVLGRRLPQTGGPPRALGYGAFSPKNQRSRVGSRPPGRPLFPHVKYGISRDSLEPFVGANSLQASSGERANPYIVSEDEYTTFPLIPAQKREQGRTVYGRIASIYQEAWYTINTTEGVPAWIKTRPAEEMLKQVATSDPVLLLRGMSAEELMEIPLMAMLNPSYSLPRSHPFYVERDDPIATAAVETQTGPSSPKALKHPAKAGLAGSSEIKGAFGAKEDKKHSGKKLLKDYSDSAADSEKLGRKKRLTQHQNPDAKDGSKAKGASKATYKPETKNVDVEMVDAEVSTRHARERRRSVETAEEAIADEEAQYESDHALEDSDGLDSNGKSIPHSKSAA